MRRIGASIAIALSTLLFVSICSAQQTSHNTPAKSALDNSALPPGPLLGGDGTKDYIPIWTTPSYLQSSVIYQDATTKNIGVGTTTPMATLDVNGGINTAATYQIGGNNVVNIGSPTDLNLFLGPGAGQNNVAGQGIYNVFSGSQAGNSNTTGNSNTFSGTHAGFSNTTGSHNTFSGNYAGASNDTGYDNTFSGFYAGFFNTTGDRNTFFADHAGYQNTTGFRNSFFGFDAGFDNTTGISNTFLGGQAGFNNTTGSSNIFLGYIAGKANDSGSNNIYIGNQGPDSGTESKAIRIGDPAIHTTAYIAGIYDANSSSGIPFYINSNGQLGTQLSSLRFKEQVRDMGDSTNALMKLRPVTFLYKPEYVNGERTLQYGLIAEEVADVYPELVSYDRDGQPYAVRYQYITTMLLNEVQKQYHRAEAEAKVITAQEEKIEQLEQRLSRLEGLVRAKVQTVAQERE